MGGLISGAMQAKAAEKAAKVQAEASEKALELQKYMYDTSRQDMMPWLTAGSTALDAYMFELGLSPNPTGGSSSNGSQMPSWMSGMEGSGTGSFGSGIKFSGNTDSKLGQRFMAGFNSMGGSNPFSAMMQKFNGMGGGSSGTSGTATATPQRQSNFMATPSYKFRVSEGEKGVLNNLSALGMKNSGKALKSLETFRQGIAADEYDKYLNRLAGLSGAGQVQSGNMGQMSANAANSMSNSINDAGAARASGYVNSANAMAGGINSAFNAIGNIVGMGMR